MTEPALNTQLYNKVVDIAKAQDVYLRAVRQLDAARQSEAEAARLVNERQREFDAIVFRLRSLAPRGTHWQQPGSPWPRPVGIPVPSELGKDWTDQ